LDFRSFILSFLKNKGIHVFTSIVYTKLISFFITYLAIRLILKDEFGNITYSLQIISFIVPIMGLGAFQGLIRYGSKLKSQQQIYYLFNYTLKRGLVLTVLLSISIFVLSSFFTQNLPDSAIYLRIFSFQIIGLTLFEFIKNYFRLIKKNELYAKWEMVYYSVLFIISLGLIKYMGALGYVISLTVTPLIVSIIIILKYNLLKLNISGIDNYINVKEFWKYGIIVSFGMISTQLLYVVDVFMIANLTKDSASLAIYKAASLIPFSLRFIPFIFIKTDFVKLANNEKNRSFLLGYYLNYLKIFIPLSLILIVFFYGTREYWGVFFGNDYKEVSDLIWIFPLALTSGYVLWVPISNMLKVTDKVHLNVYISVLALVINVVLNYFLIKEYGIYGAAWGTTISMWVSGVLALIVFYYYLKELK